MKNMIGHEKNRRAISPMYGRHEENLGTQPGLKRDNLALMVLACGVEKHLPILLLKEKKVPMEILLYGRGVGVWGVERTTMTA